MMHLHPKTEAEFRLTTCNKFRIYRCFFACWTSHQSYQIDRCFLGEELHASLERLLELAVQWNCEKHYAPLRQKDLFYSIFDTENNHPHMVFFQQHVDGQRRFCQRNLKCEFQCTTSKTCKFGGSPKSRYFIFHTFTSLTKRRSRDPPRSRLLGVWWLSVDLVRWWNSPPLRLVGKVMKHTLVLPLFFNWNGLKLETPPCMSVGSKMFAVFFLSSYFVLETCNDLFVSL